MASLQSQGITPALCMCVIRKDTLKKMGKFADGHVYSGENEHYLQGVSKPALYSSQVFMKHQPPLVLKAGCHSTQRIIIVT